MQIRCTKKTVVSPWKAEATYRLTRLLAERGQSQGQRSRLLESTPAPCSGPTFLAVEAVEAGKTTSLARHPLSSSDHTWESCPPLRTCVMPPGHSQ